MRKFFQIGSGSAAGGTAVHVVGFNLRSWTGFPDNAVVQKSVLAIIGLTGYGKLSGKYFIDKVSLTYSRNGLEQTLECSKIPDEKTTTTGAGASVTLNNAPLYYTSVDKKPVRRISGHYFLYDGINVAGRYRITNLQSRCGKTPVGKNVTGWVDAADVGGAT